MTPGVASSLAVKRKHTFYSDSSVRRPQKKTQSDRVVRPPDHSPSTSCTANHPSTMNPISTCTCMTSPFNAPKDDLALKIYRGSERSPYRQTATDLLVGIWAYTFADFTNACERELSIIRPERSYERHPLRGPAIIWTVRMKEGIGRSCWVKCSRYISSAVIDTG